MYLITIISLALQMVGSTMLLYVFFKRINKENINTPYAVTPLANEKENPQEDLKSKFYKRNYTNIYYEKVVLSRISFVYLFFGYLISVFGSLEGRNRIIAFRDVFVWYIIISLISILLVTLWTGVIKKGIQKYHKI